MTEFNQKIDQLRKDVQAVKETQNKARNELLNSTVISDITVALNQLTYVEPEDNLLIDKLKSVVESAQYDSSIRTKAMEKIMDSIAGQQDTLSWLLPLVSDQTESDEVREYGLNLLQRISFGSSALEAMRPEYTSLLKKLVDDPNLRIGGAALTSLATRKDPDAQIRLVEGIISPDKSLVPISRAIQLLGLDTKGEHVQVIKDALNVALGNTELASFSSLSNAMPANEKNKVIIEAIHSLAEDEDSSDLIRSLALDKSMASEIRVNAINLLTKPDKLRFIAKQIIDDPTENPEIQFTCLSALLHVPHTLPIHFDKEFNDKIVGLSKGGNWLSEIALKYLNERNDLKE